MSPLSVLYLAGEFPPAVGGVADYTQLLAEAVQAQGARVGVLATGPTGEGSREGIREVEVRRAPNWGPATVHGLAQWLRQGWDIVHLQYQAAAFARSRLVHGLPLWLRGLGVRSRFVTTFHDLRPPYLFPKVGPLRSLALQALAHLSDGAVYTDPADLAASAHRPARAWIPIGPNLWPGESSDRSQARAQWGFREGEPVLVYFGLLNASKGLSDLLEAVDRVRAAGAPVRLLMVGDERGASDATNRQTAREFWREAEQRDLLPRITQTGWLAPAEVGRALAAADLAVLPYVDGASLRRGSLLACLAHGLPVVTTRPAPGPPAAALQADVLLAEPEALALDERTVAVCEPGDGAALANAICRLLRSAEERERLAQAGRRFAAQLSWDRIAGAHVRFYRRLLAA